MNTRTHTRRRGQAAFTLIEVLVVVLIIGLLVGLVAPNVYNALIRGQKGTAKAQIRNIQAAVEQYQLNNNRLPDSLEDLTEPDVETGRPYMDRIPNDPWEFQYVMEINNDGSFEILSYGADGAPGGEGEDADISSLDF